MHKLATKYYLLRCNYKWMDVINCWILFILKVTILMQLYHNLCSLPHHGYSLCYIYGIPCVLGGETFQLFTGSRMI